MGTVLKATAEMIDMLKKAGDNDYNVAMNAQHELAIALTTPLRQGVMKGDIIGDIFQTVPFEPGVATEFPLDFLAPGTEKDHIAYTIPNIGRIPERKIEGDFLMVPVFDVGNSIDWALKYARDARWDIVRRAMAVLEGGFVRKANNDGWHTILAAVFARNLGVFDSFATAGMFSPRLLTLAQGVMRRNAGGNSTSVNRGKLTDVYMSPEGLGDVRSWDLSVVPDAVRAQIYLTQGENPVTNIFGVKLHEIDELGEGQEYQNYFVNTLGGTLGGSKLELAVGLDLSTDDCFVMPVVEEIKIFEDTQLHRSRRAGLYAWQSHGFGDLDARRSLQLSF